MSSLDRGALRSLQLEKLRALLKTTLASNRFYSAKLGLADVGAELHGLEDFEASVPFTLKQEFVDDQCRNPPFGSNLAYPLTGYSRFHQTSGSASTPVRWLDTPQSWSRMLDCWDRIFEAAGVEDEDRLFFPFSFGPFLGFWTAFEAATRAGRLAIPGGGVRTLQRLRVILDNEVTVICATPTYAIRMGETAVEENIDLSAGKVRAIIVAGEPGGSVPATRALIEKLWPGARVYDHHGMTEVGPVTYPCPRRAGVLHVMEASYFPEVIDAETLRAAPPGETGELVLTNLDRLGSPVIRYRTRDIVRRSEAVTCECGSEELALEGGILSRVDDMVVVRGTNLYPSAVEDVLRADRGVGEFRVEIKTDRGMAEVSLSIEPSAAEDDTGALATRVADSLYKAFGLRFSVGCVPRGQLPRFEAKSKRWVRV
jgi:phenylacetate-CoA ligase